MNYLGLIFEFVFLAGGVYLYLFSRGIVRTEKGGSFLKENKNLIRFGSMALVAIMLINIILHIRDILS